MLREELTLHSRAELTPFGVQLAATRASVSLHPSTDLGETALAKAAFLSGPSG